MKQPNLLGQAVHPNNSSFLDLFPFHRNTDKSQIPQRSIIIDTSAEYKRAELRRLSWTEEGTLTAFTPSELTGGRYCLAECDLCHSDRHVPNISVQCVLETEAPW